MSSTAIMDAILGKIKAVLSKGEEILASEVSPEQAEEVNRVLGEAMSAGWTEGLQKWLVTAETDAEAIKVDGVTYRYKLDSEKEFLTPGGVIKLTRRVYQPDAGGKCYIPLDTAWGMEGQFATVAVRDAALYAVALGTPQEAETLLGKCSLFQPSATAIKRSQRAAFRTGQEEGPPQRTPARGGVQGNTDPNLLQERDGGQHQLLRRGSRRKDVADAFGEPLRSPNARGSRADTQGEIRTGVA